MRVSSQGSAHPESLATTSENGVLRVSSTARSTPVVDVDRQLSPTHPLRGPRSAAALAGACGTRLYPGSSPQRRRRGWIRTSPGLLAALGHRRTSAALTLPASAHLGVACWTSRIDWLIQADIAYQLHYKAVRPIVCDEKGRGGVSRKTFAAVCEARATGAEWDTGRGSRLSVDRIMRITGLSESTVQRATRLMRVLGVATEIFRGRQRTLIERIASWRIKDKGQGWASVYALHPPRNPQVRALKHRLDPRPDQPVTPHLLRSRFSDSSHQGLTQLEAGTGSACGEKRRAPRDSCEKEPPGKRRYRPVDPQGVRLAARWLSDPRTPPWARRHSAAGWARVLAAPAAHRWESADINQVITDYRGVTGHWIAADPRHPIKLLAGILKWHGADNLADRPAAAILAQEAEAIARRRAIAECARCSEYGWELDAEGVETEPARRCTH